MQKRLSIAAHFPDALRLYRELDAVIKQAGIDPLHLELIKTRASQLNGCAYCLDLHINDAIQLGENPRRMYVLSAWREARDWFTEEECVILELTEQVTLIGKHGISDEVYGKALLLFGEPKLAHIIMAAISINAWNRIGVGLNLHPKK